MDGVGGESPVLELDDVPLDLVEVKSSSDSVPPLSK
jgi:hypothetical protein